MTSNSGANWVVSELPLNYNIQGSFFLNSLTGYVCGLGGLIAKTNDGAQTWTTQNSGTNRNLTFMYFKDINTGYALGGSLMLRTSDAGNKWNVAMNDTLTVFYTMHFPSPSVGYSAGDRRLPNSSAVLKTTNGGISWDSLPRFGQWVRSIQFFNENTGYAGGAGLGLAGGDIFKTTNGGQNWFVVLNESNASVDQISFLNVDFGFALSNNYSRLYKTTDGGSNWLTIETPIIYNYSHLNSIYFLNIETGYCAGSDGMMFRTSNSGANWSFISSEHWFLPSDIKFINSNTGFVCDGPVRRTTNGGITWDTVYAPPSYLDEIYRLQIFRSDIIFAAGMSGNFIKSTNGGNNWLQYNSGAGSTTYGISFPDQNTGYIITKTGSVGKTTNGGMNWFGVAHIGAFGQDIFFVNSNTGFAVGGGGMPIGGKLLKTTNGGMNWQQRVFNEFDWMFSVFFTDSVTGYAVGNYQSYDTIRGYILKTTNQGSNWQISPPLNDVRIAEIYFPSEDTGYACTGGNILKTTDAGGNWLMHRSCTNNWLQAIHFVNNLTGYAVGGLSTVIKTTTGGNEFVIGIEPISHNIPEKFILHQNYPNPFNPVTKIKFDMPSSALNETGKRGEFFSLKVYDILGREVATLVNEFLRPGTYELEFSGINYPSGVYFYRLIAGEFTDSKKMILIK